MVELNDFRNAGGVVDWTAYRQAEVDAGEKCMTCGKFIFSLRPKVPGPQQCHDCEKLRAEVNEVSHSKMVRCPYCKHSWDLSEYISENAEYRYYEDGEHDIDCPECEKTFKIATHVSYSFTSPELNELDEDHVKCSGEDCDEIVERGDEYFATPCGTFCTNCMVSKHAVNCEICAREFDLDVPELEDGESEDESERGSECNSSVD